MKIVICGIGDSDEHKNPTVDTLYYNDGSNHPHPDGILFTDHFSECNGHG